MLHICYIVASDKKNSKGKPLLDSRFIAVFAVILVLLLLPFAVIYPTGISRAGLSHGFLMLLQNPFHVMLVMLVGIWASLMDRYSVVLLPVSFILMFLIGAIMSVGIQDYPFIHMFMLGSVLLFAITVSLRPRRNFIAAVVICGSLAYHLGFFYSQSLPSQADGLFFILGEILSLMLVLAASISLGTAFHGSVGWIKQHNHPQ